MACVQASLRGCAATRAGRLLAWTASPAARIAPSLARAQPAQPQLPGQRAARRSPLALGVRAQATVAGAVGAPKDGMDPAVENTVEKIHSSTSRMVLFLGGGASQAVAWILSVPGASRTVLDIQIPYSRAALADLLGRAPEVYADPGTARAMAVAAYKQAAKLSPMGTDVVGVGCTCALATDREKRGEHKAFICTYTGTQERSVSLLLSKGARSRYGEDTLASKLLVKAVAESMGISASLIDLGLIEEGEAADQFKVESRGTDMDAVLKELINGRVDTVEFSGGNMYVDAPRPGRIYLPGSFNPLHDGHKEMLQAASRLRPKMEAAFELSIGNADKGILPMEDIKQRVAQFTTSGLPLVVTQAPLFTQKADLFHNSVFVVGYDTAVRLVRAEYYGNDQAMLLQFAKLKHQGCSFLVAGRRDDADGKFKTLADLQMPPTLPQGGLFEEIPASDFRADVSSTELRAAARR